MVRNRVILAYSGGLDTSCILKWLLEHDYEVICYMANIGQVEDFNKAEQKALKIGAKKVVIEDIRDTFVEHYVWPAIQAGLIYESRYLLGTSLARPCISVGLIKCAREYSAEFIAHGATGKGNDQVRFELSCYALSPGIKIIAPWRIEEFTSRFQGRQDLIEYATQNNIPVAVTPQSPWSMDANLMHISYESGILEDPNNEAPSDLFQMTRNPKLAPEESCRIEIEFKEGLPSKIITHDRSSLNHPLSMFSYLNKIGGMHGVGRIDIVENRFVGMKSRGVYESPGAFILYTAHTDLELFCLDKEIYQIKKSLSDRLSNYVYNGFWFAPEGDYTRKCIEIAEKNVNGTVKLEIYKGSVIILGRSSPISLYNQDLVSMDIQSNFTPTDATGFINIHAIRLKEYKRFQDQQQ